MALAFVREVGCNHAYKAARDEATVPVVDRYETKNEQLQHKRAVRSQPVVESHYFLRFSGKYHLIFMEVSGGCQGV